MVNDTQQIQHKSSFWQWKEGLSSEICDLLLTDRNKFEETKGTILGADAKKDLNKSVRDSSICWAPINHWAEGIMYNFGLYAAENAGWSMQLGRPEQVQLAMYDKDGFYGWHEDWAPFLNTPTIRKISIVALLSDPSEFEGGEFQFDKTGAVEMKRGSVIAFPSFIRHQVTPVTSGKRYSAVCWINGPNTF